MIENTVFQSLFKTSLRHVIQGMTYLKFCPWNLFFLPSSSQSGVTQSNGSAMNYSIPDLHQAAELGGTCFSLLQGCFQPPQSGNIWRPGQEGKATIWAVTLKGFWKKNILKKNNSAEQLYQKVFQRYLKLPCLLFATGTLGVPEMWVPEGPSKPVWLQSDPPKPLATPTFKP